MQGLKWESPENVGTKSGFSPSLFYFSHDLIWFHPNARFFFFFFFFTLCFLLHTRILLFIFTLSSLAFLYFYINFVFLCLSLYLHRRPHNSHIGKHCKQNTLENFINCAKITKNQKTQAHCHKHKHKPTAHNRSENTNTNPHRCWA